MSYRHLAAVTMLMLVVSAKAQAANVVTTVFNVLESKKSERLLILSGVDGRVYKAPRTKTNIAFYKSLTGQIVNISYELKDQEALITGVRPVDSTEIDAETADLNYFRYNELRQFAPTELKSEEEAATIFKDMLNDGDKSRSQCFKRAHIWSFDMWSKLGIFSQKIFMFYTKRFAILEDFEWWFHVAPMVVANGKELVMDGTFMDKPMEVKPWADFFMKTDKITCPVVDTYQEYEKHEWTRLCVLMKVPMYYFSPLDLENRDKEGKVKNHWVLPELQDARRAFRGGESTYEGLDTGKPNITY